MSIHYVPGNHDLTFVGLFRPGTGFFNVKKIVRLQDGGKTFVFMRGHQLEVLSNLEPLTVEECENLCLSLCQRTGDLIGDLLSFFWDSIHVLFKKGDRRNTMVQAIGDIPEKRSDLSKVDLLARSPVKTLLLGPNKSDRLVFGHTHRPFLDESVANVGS